MEKQEMLKEICEDNTADTNTKIQDFRFINKFKKEWEEITEALRKIRDEGQTKITNEKSYRLTSSSLIFK